MSNQPNKPPTPPHVAVSLLGDVIIAKPADKPAFLFHSRLWLQRYMLAPQSIRPYEVRGLAAECVNSWFTAGLRFTFACESLDPVILSFRLATGLTIAVTDEVPAEPWPRYLDGVDLLITPEEAVRSKRPATAEIHPHIAELHGENPNAGAIAAAVLTFQQFHNSRR